jgi:hypothetical protein
VRPAIRSAVRCTTQGRQSNTPLQSSDSHMLWRWGSTAIQNTMSRLHSKHYGIPRLTELPSQGADRGRQHLRCSVGKWQRCMTCLVQGAKATEVGVMVVRMTAARLANLAQSGNESAWSCYSNRHDLHARILPQSDHHTTARWYTQN